VEAHLENRTTKQRAKRERCGSPSESEGERGAKFERKADQSGKKEWSQDD